MSFFDRLFGRRDANEAVRPLYNAVIALGRERHWYEQGGVPDTIDGRFEMIAACLSLVIARLELEAEQRQNVAWLVELFVSDMDSQLREIGIGDMVVGKHIGRMMGALGGRIGAYRDGLRTGTFEAALVRNLYRGTEPPAAALDHAAERLRALYLGLHAASADSIIAGRLP
ncbi:ubiquinol-cytochrome C chaperone family protein [Sphingomonas sp.]|uniref:ubiquinol-cytochrome C chaperone family protein n=1 Tax=Sphingomonas sp. TaxID=28214 RepID=UPI002DF2134B|nr:ubiquinol-cytochrome C chaperone family protein [Sphingomonas sp.]